MHPLTHARSSANRLGGDPLDYIAVHEWFDATKAHVAHVSHRIFRHHRQGIEMAVTAFGDRNGFSPEAIRDLGIQHLAEDTSGILTPGASDWLQEMRLPVWVRSPEIEAGPLAEASAARFGGDVADWLPLHSWFLETRHWVEEGDRRHLAMRHHSMGIFEAEAKFGRAVATRDGERVPLRPVAEWHVRTLLGRIPTAGDWCQGLHIRSWMVPRPGRALGDAVG